MNKPATIKVPHVVEVVSIGEEQGVIIPAEMLKRLGLSEGDKLVVVEGAEGLAFRRQESEFDRQMAIGRDVMKRRRSVLRELAK